MKPIKVLGGKVLEDVLQDERGSARPTHLAALGLLITLATLLTFLLTRP
jgi:hypothetical protein